MQISTWLWSWLESRRQQHTPQSPLDYAARLTLRKLEERQVLNVTVAFDGGTGTLALSTTTNDAVVVTVDNGTHDVFVNGHDTGVQASAVHELQVTASGNFDNTIDLTGVTSSDFTQSGFGVSVYAGDGNDVISMGYAEHFTIDGEAGNDTIHVDTALSLDSNASFLTAETIDIGAVVISTNSGSLTFDGTTSLTSSALSGEFYFNGNTHLNSSSISGDIHLGGDIFADTGTNTINGQLNLSDPTHTFTVDDLATLDINANIGDSDSVAGAGIMKDGDGVLTLAGTNNTYTGATEIVAGTLALTDASSDNNIASSAQILIDSAGFLDVNGLQSSTFVLDPGQTFKTLSVYVDDNWAGGTYAPGTYVANVDGQGHSGVYGLTAFGSIQSAVDAVSDDGIVEINDGTYMEPVTIDKSLTLDGLSGVAAHIVIVGDTSDGISITSGATNVTVSDLTIENSLDGIHAENVSGTLTFNNVVATNNSADGFDLNTIGAVSFVNVVASNNSGDGIGIVSVAGAVNIQGATLDGNDLGGVVVSNANSVSFINGSITNNTGGTGIEIDGVATSVSLNNTTVTGNSGDGLLVLPNGAVPLPGANTVTITGGTYSANGGDGIHIDGVTTSVDIDSAHIENNSNLGFEISNTAAVTLSNLTLLTNGSTTVGGSVTNVETLTFNTTIGNDTVDVNSGASSTFQQLTQQAISYSTVTTLNVNTLAGNDIVNVTPDAATKIYLDGGIGTDTLTIDASSSTITPDGVGFTVTTANQPVYAQNFENVQFSGAVVFGGTAGDDTLILTATDSDTATYEFYTDGVLVASGAIDNVTSVEFDGGDGDDLLVINNPVTGVFEPTGGINFNAGANGENTSGGNPAGDSLQINGGTATTVEYQINDTNGSVLYDNSSALSYTGVSSIVDTISAPNRVFTFSGANETITIQDAGTSGQTQIGVTSQQITFANPTTLLSIDAGAGDDVVNFDGTVQLASSSTISVDAETINVNDGAELDVAGGTISLTASKLITLTGSGTMTANDLSLVTDSIGIASTATITGTTVEIHQFTDNTEIDLGSTSDPTGGPLSLSDVELHQINAVTLTIGDSHSGSITVSDNVSVANVTTLQLITGASVIDTGAAVLTVVNLAIEAVSGIGDGEALELVVGKLAFQNTTSGNVEIHNTGAITVGSVGILDGSVGHKVGNFGGGTLQLSAASPITIAIDTTSVGSATITAGESDDAPTFADKLTIAAGSTVSVTGSGSNLTLQAGDDIVVNGSASSAFGNVVLEAGFGDLDGAGAIAIAGQITAANLISMSAVTGITDSGGAQLSALQLELTGSGDVVLTQHNQIDTIAADLAGSLIYRGVNTFTVGTAGATTGITLVSGGSLDLTAASGNIELDANIATEGTQTFHAGIDLLTNVTLNSGSGDITFDDTINGTYSLTVNTSGVTSFGTDIGTNNALTSLTTDSAGTTVIAASQIRAGSVTFNDAVQIRSDVAILAGAITFGGTLDESAVAGSTSNVTLSINAVGGDVLFTGAVGHTIALDSLKITTADDVTFTSTVETLGNLEQVAGTGTTTFHGTGANGIGGQLLVTTGNIHLATAGVTTTGAVNLNAAQAITVDAGLNAGSSTIAIHANTAGTGTAGFTQTAGIIQTTNNSASAVEITVGGSGDAKVSDIRADVTTGRVTIDVAGGQIIDGDLVDSATTADITANEID